MADNTRSTWDPFLLEMQGSVHEMFPSEAPFLAELSGYGDPNTVGRITKAMDGNRQVFSGRKVRHTLILNGLQAGGFPGENGTWNVPIPLVSKEVHVTLADVIMPFSVTVDVERDSFDHSMANAVKTLIQQAQTATSRLENLAMLGNGDGLVGTITDSATSLTTTFMGGNIDVILPGTVWDVLTRSSGADPGNGKRRLVSSVSWTSDSAGTITWSTTSQASDGGSGNITHASTEGIYIPGSYGNVMQGLQQAAATTGTFQDLDKALNAQWAGSDGRAGVTSTKMLSEQMLDGGVRVGRRAGAGYWDFGLGDPAAIDGYKQGVYAQRRYDPTMSTLKSGFSGIEYDGATKPFPLIKEPMHKKASLELIRKDGFQLYGDSKGPDFLTDDGSMFRRFNRNSSKEAELMDRVQLCATECNKIVFFNNLDVAAAG